MPRRRWFTNLSLVIAGLMLAGLFYQALASLIDAYRYPPAGQLVDMGGYRLHLNCQGQPGQQPTVVMEAGMAENSLTWSLVAPQIAVDMQVCTYDRAGLGWSDPGPKNPTAADRTQELRDLLKNAGIQPPYVLVGHSLGAAYAFDFMQRYPNDTSGLVLVDPGDDGTTGGFEEWVASQALTASDLKRFQVRYTALMTPGKKLDLLRLGAPLVAFGIPRMYFNLVYKMTPAFPPELQARLTGVDRALRTRYGYINASIQEEDAAPLVFPVVYVPQATCGSKPVIVLSAKKAAQYPDQDTTLVADLIQNWLAFRHGQLAACSSQGSRLVVEGSGHYIQIDNPTAVISAIKDVVSRASK